MKKGFHRFDEAVSRINSTTKPKAGIRLWLQLEEIATTSFQGLLLCAVHWKDDTVYGEDSQWTHCQGDSYEGCLPSFAIADSLMSEEFERELYVRPSTSEVFMWLGLRLAISTRLPLRRFPYDRQQLRVGVTCGSFILVEWHLSDPPKKDANLTHCKGSCRVDSDIQNFRLANVKPLDYINADSSSSYVRMLFLVERDASMYEWNFGLTTYLVVLLNGTVLGLDIDALADRMSLTLTLLLTLVAQKFVTSQYVPVVGYNTLLDKYMNVALLWLGVNILEISFMKIECCHVASEDTCLYIDTWFHLVMMGVWTLAHVVLCIFREGLRISWETVPSQYIRQTVVAHRQSLSSDSSSLISSDSD